MSDTSLISSAHIDRLAELAVKSNVKRFVYVSSVKAAEKSSVRSIHNNEGV